MPEKISVYGLGKLGCTMAACFAHKGWTTIGVDTNTANVEKINKGLSPIYEPGVAELIAANRDRLTATADAQSAFKNSDVSFIIVPTPSLKDGSFSTEFVLNVAKNIAIGLREKDYHLIVITSTVLLGDTEAIGKVINEVSGKKYGVDYGLCYSPDFIALGRIVHDFLNPDMVLIGQSDDRAGAMLESIHKRLVDNSPTIHRMSFHNAELAKIGLNSYCTMKITFANVLAEICEKMPGGDAYVVTQAIGADGRVGQKYIRPGLSAGGPCFSRDNRAFNSAAAKFGVKQTLGTVVDEINDYHKSYRITKILTDMLKEKSSDRLSVLGLTYKEDTTLVEEACPIEVIRHLCRQNIKITAYDPAGIPDAQKILEGSPNIVFCNSIDDCLRGTSVCFVAAPWKQFKEIHENVFLSEMKNPLVLDAWNLYGSFSKGCGVDVRTIGKKA